MVLLTIVVWIYMYIRRIHFLNSRKILIDQIRRQEDLARISPDAVHYPSDNLKNLFEMPVLFYVLVVYLFVSKQVDSVYVLAAWVYVFFRTVHSGIHCIYNRVIPRFCAYLFSCLTLFFIVGRALIAHHVS
jgi:hypothetical protein